MSDHTSENKKDMSDWKPGSDPAGAKNAGGDRDFGVPADGGSLRDREYASENTRRSDPGHALPRSGDESERSRVSGVGANAGGEGSGSGGDIDTDFVGVAGGSGLAASPPGGRIGKDASDGSSDEMASGGRAQGRNQDNVGRVGSGAPVRGSTLNRSGDPSSAQGADGTNASARGDDSFAGEVSTGEASGDDEPLH